MVYPVNAEVEFSCTRSFNLDTPPVGSPELDEMASTSTHPRWACTHNSVPVGTWENDDCIGENVTWIAPSTPITPISVNVYEDDLPSAPDREDNERNVESRTISVVETDLDIWWVDDPDEENPG